MALPGASSTVPCPVEEGGGRTPSESSSFLIKPLSRSDNFFKILDESPALMGFVLSNLRFHISIFPFMRFDSKEH